jgi:hypothetical protein
VDGRGPGQRQGQVVEDRFRSRAGQEDSLVGGQRQGAARQRDPVLTTAKNNPADWPAFSSAPTGAPRTKTFLIEMSPTVVPAPSVGWCHWVDGALFPASHPASTGINAAIARTIRRRGLLAPWLLQITACSPRLRNVKHWERRTA